MKPFLTALIPVLWMLQILASCDSNHYSDIVIGERESDYILEIARKIADAGPHNAGTPEEALVGDLIMGELEEMGIGAERQAFTFETFQLDEMVLELEGTAFHPLFAGINPFGDSLSLDADLYFLNEEGNPSSNPDGKVLVSSNPDLFFMALQAGAKGFLSLTREEYEIISLLERRPAKLRIKGSSLQRPSSNIVATIGQPGPGCAAIYFTAHYDSYLSSPGANDNGTGVGGLLAMARILKSVENSLPCQVKLIFLSAEEVGLVGSRTYVSSHLDELSACKMLLNFDTFGGNQGPYIATARGQQGIPASGIQNQLDPDLSNRALEGPGGQWRMFHPSLFPMVMSSNYPEWVQSIVDSVSHQLDMEVFNQHLMSDHLIFAQAGVPAISIQSREHRIHSEEDVPEHINRETVSSCFLLSWEILKRLFESEWE